MTLSKFNKELKSCGTPEKRLEFIRKIFFHGVPAVFQNDSDKYFEFRQLIANKFNVNFSEVMIVGSAKLGFSWIKGTRFTYESDVDVVIINENLFEEYMYIICDYQYSLDRNRRLIDLSEKRTYNSFLEYIAKGWMRPDKLPYSFQVDVLKSDWFEFFRSISNNKSNIGNYGVKAGLYKNYYYLEHYYINAIENYYKKLTVEGESNGTSN